jgi:nitroreductase
MDYQELLLKRRSIRDFEDKPVATAMIQELLQETTLAPTASNAQPCKFIIITDRALMKRLSDDSKANLLRDFAANPNDRLQMYQDALKNESFNVFYNAPCLILVVGSKKTLTLDWDVALTVSYLMFAAAARGLGTCWINLGSNIRSQALLTEIGLPADCRIVAPIILGYPRAMPAASERHSPDIIKIIPEKA